MTAPFLTLPFLLLSDQINSDPYTAGWIMKVKMSNKGDAGKLMDAAAYKAETDH